jgi:hypothetical protein
MASDPRGGLLSIGEEIWCAERPLRFFLVEMGTRMTVVRLEDGGLLVHSPVGLDADLREEVDALGPVRAIVAPSRFHHLFVPEWMEAYPAARAWACPGLPEKRPDVRWHGVLSDEADPTWAADLGQIFFGARALENEVVFFHERSKTLVSSDLVFNLSSHDSWFTRTIAWLAGNHAPGTTLIERVLLRDRAAGRAQVERMLAWNFERLLIAHGPPVMTGARDVLRRAYAWL